MKSGLLLDSHVLLWLQAQAPIRPETRLEIGRAGAASSLFMSDISIWELGVAFHRKSLERRPDLQGLSINDWFHKMTARFDIRPLRITSRIAVEAAEVPAVYGSGDPGDCFLITTARIRNLTLVTRDSKIIKLANQQPDYLKVIEC